MIKLHICCGDVYLDGYINIDIKGKLVRYITKNPNKTNLANYYKYEFKKNKPREFIIDKEMNILEKWDYNDNSVDEIIMICAIEHFTKVQALKIINEIKRVLKPNGIFIVDFPDIKSDVELYYNRPEYLMELIYCNQKNELSTHRWGYTKKSFIELLGEGWKNIDWLDIVKHDYPMFGCFAKKE